MAKVGGEIGLTPREVVEAWNTALRGVNSKLAPLQAPPGVDTDAMERNPSVIRVPDVDRQAMYSVLVDMTASLLAVVDQNNKRIGEQLKAAGVKFK